MLRRVFGTIRSARRAAFSGVVLLVLLAASAARAQQPAVPIPPPEPPPVAHTPPGYTIERDVNLVTLHVSVSGEDGQFVPGLGRESFRVFEDNVPQQISVLRQEDVPVSMGLLIDNSGSMYDKRAAVNAAALTLVQASNPDDEVFVAHFNDNYFFDLDKDFSSDLGELRKALAHRDSEGTTALYDAVLNSLNHLKKGYSDKKVLLIVSDGEDNYSRATFAALLDQAQRSSALIYAVGLLTQEKPESAARDRQALLSLAEATGGAAFFPTGVPEVESICAQIARDIRHQYTVGYYPSNASHDGSFRSLRVEVVPPPGGGKLSVRARTGYFGRTSIGAN